MRAEAELNVSKWNTSMGRGFSMTDNTKYEINRRYPLESGFCPVDGEAVVTVWLKTKARDCASGKARDCASGKALDLYWGTDEVTHFMVLEYPPENKVRWMNVYENGTSGFYKTKEVADRYATLRRTECIRVEYMDGEGL